MKKDIQLPGLKSVFNTSDQYTRNLVHLQCSINSDGFTLVIMKSGCCSEHKSGFCPVLKLIQCSVNCGRSQPVSQKSGFCPVPKTQFMGYKFNLLDDTESSFHSINVIRIVSSTNPSHPSQGVMGYRKYFLPLRVQDDIGGRGD